MTLEGSKLRVNKWGWDRFSNIVYVDQPIGTGFSQGTFFDYPTSEEKIWRQLKIFFNKFYDIFPKYRGRDVYITGESYAGHYIPNIAVRWTKYEMRLKWGRLKGVAIGNGWVDPYLQIPKYASFAFNNNLINKPSKVVLDIGFKLCQYLI